MAIAVAFAIGAAVTVLAASGGFSTLEWKLYDAYLGLLPARPMPGTFLVVYPESGGSPKRRSAKDALQVLRLLDEFEVGEVALVGDPFEGGAELEELSALRSGLPGLVDRESKSVQDNIRALFGAIRSGSIPPRELGRYVDLLAGIVATSGERIKEGSGIEQGSTLRELEAEIARYRHYGASFPGIQADPDKVLRRLPLVEKADDGLVSPRVELEALMRTLGNPLLEYEAGRVMLRDATSSEPRKPKAVIPVDGEGRALLDWSRTEKEEKVRKIAVGEVLKAIQEEEAFYAALVAMEAGGLLGGDGSALLSRYRHAQMLGEARAPADKAASADWRDSRKEFFMAAQGYFDAGHEAGLVAALEVVKETTVLNSDGLAAIDDRIAEITRSYRESAAILKALVARRGELSASIGGSFAFLSLVPAEAPLLTSFGMATNPA